MDLSFYSQEVAPAMLRGLWVSIGLILPSVVFGLAIGVLAGTLRVYGRPFWKRLSWFSSTSGISACPSWAST